MPTVMVVEDDEELNEVLCYNLQKAGYEVASVLDGNQAVEQIDNDPPDLVLLDIMLPGLDGWKVCQHLSTREDLDALPVIIFTAKSAREDFDRARNFPNFAGYFVKPYATRDVVRHVGKVLGRPT